MRTYAVTVFLSAFLLFQVEPIVARHVLPWFGGSASVWTTCLLFFQLVLLGGYAFAHLVEGRLTARSQVIVQLGLITLSVITMAILTLVWQSPFLAGPAWKPGRIDFPALQILLLLTASVGLPYFVLATTTPLIQAWFARTHETSPYRLYALSNLGSLLALLSYPFMVEPNIALRTQSYLWFLLFVLFAASIALAGRILWKLPTRDVIEGEDPREVAMATSVGTYALWVSLAACASLMLYASTVQMSQDIAPIPFLWILPLALYLISFIICFDSERWYRRGIFHPALAIAIFISFPILAWGDQGIAFLSRIGIAPQRMSLIVQLGTSALLLFTICMVCHGELVRMRPHRRNLTSFYLAVSIGGALGGLMAALVAPLIFRGYWEFRFAISLATLLLFIVLIRDRTSWIYHPHPIVLVLLPSAALVLPELMGVVARSSFYNIAAIGFVILFWTLYALRHRFDRLNRPSLFAQLLMLPAILVIAAVAVTVTMVGYRSSVLVTRNFYGVLRIMTNGVRDPEWRAYQMWSGRIMHGEQFFAKGKRFEPTSYYGPESGIGLLVSNHPNRGKPDSKDWPLRIGVVGLGTGTIAAWGGIGDYIRYYEINPAAIALATEPGGYFTFVRDSSAKVEIIPGDARLSMEREIAGGHPQNFDILAIDAFSGDAIPAHLLTREAIATYLAELAPDGVLALHISNRFLNLAPLARELAHSFNLKVGDIFDRPDNKMYDDSEWVLMSRTDRVLSQPEIAAKLKPLDPKRKAQVWTDDYSNLYELIR